MVSRVKAELEHEDSINYKLNLRWKFGTVQIGDWRETTNTRNNKHRTKGINYLTLLLSLSNRGSLVLIDYQPFKPSMTISSKRKG